MRFEHHAQYLTRVVPDLIDRLRNLDAAAFTPSTGVYLRFHHPYTAAELMRRRHALIDAETRDATRCCDAISAQYFLCLIFVYFHEQPYLLLRMIRHHNLITLLSTLPLRCPPPLPGHRNP